MSFGTSILTRLVEDDCRSCLTADYFLLMDEPRWTDDDRFSCFIYGYSPFGCFLDLEACFPADEDFGSALIAYFVFFAVAAAAPFLPLLASAAGDFD